MPEPPAPAKYMPARKPVKIARPFALAMTLEGILFLSVLLAGYGIGKVG